jgi:hypothetical protein
MKDKERRKKVHSGCPKINRMKISEVHSRIESLIGKGDNSIYLKHLFLRSHKERIKKVETLIRGVCSFWNISLQQRDRYLCAANLMVWGVR